MPIYEYVCDSCGHEMEAIQRISDEPLVTCPSCEQESLRKKISAAGFRLKGGGWYETDFKSGKKKNVSGAEASDSGGSSSSDGSGDASGGGSTADSSTSSSTSSASDSGGGKKQSSGAGSGD